MESLELKVSFDVPVFSPKLPSGKSVSLYFERIEKTRIYTNFGPLERELRSRLADYLGLPMENLVATSNATVALEGAIETSLSRGSWGLPSWTFTATASSLARSGNAGEFLDVRDDWRATIPSNIENFLDVAPFGTSMRNPIEFDSTQLECLISDVAASFDTLKGVIMPTHVRAAGILSFHATKVLPGAEGGLFFSNDLEWAERFRSWSKFGMTNTRVSENVGTNAKLSEYHAALVLASLDNYQTDRVLWLKQQIRANDLTTRYGLIHQPNFKLGDISPYWIISLKTQAERDKLVDVFANHAIQTRLWWENGCHSMPAYHNFSSGDLPKTNQIASTTVGLPFWIDMSDVVWEKIEKALIDFRN